MYKGTYMLLFPHLATRGLLVAQKLHVRQGTKDNNYATEVLKCDVKTFTKVVLKALMLVFIAGYFISSNG